MSGVFAVLNNIQPNNAVIENKTPTPNVIDVKSAIMDPTDKITARNIRSGTNLFLSYLVIILFVSKMTFLSPLLSVLN